MALTYTPEQPDLGARMPTFELPTTSGEIVTPKTFDHAKALLIMFICNHCPYVKAIEDRLIELGRYCSERGVGILGISSNDPEQYPEDSFAKMKEQANKKNYTFLYAQDLSQQVAKNFGAVCTPDFFLFDQNRTLAYRGRLDDSWKDASQVRSQDLKAAIEGALLGQTPAQKQYPSMGCSIKWK